ncbi:MAG: DegV family EDD domain-containing protein [Calditrichaeota bacterium]|nr:MAG: DegV family EDD domain-containing protein [Calditrichota bacterium]
MKIDYLDGIRLKQGIIAGARRVILMQDNLNRINVFPVADNDTGTNMALTMQSIAESAISCHEESLSEMSQCLAEAALMGARGNSGAILAQFFQGLAESFRGKVTASLKQFAEAVEQARRSAFEAISEPREGTILTVIHDWTERVKKHCESSHDFLEVLREGLREAQRSLKDTPRKLKLLAKAGVVDAGAQGFVHMLEGIYHFMESGKIEKAVGLADRKVARAKVANAPEKITFQFCTECLVEGSAIDRRTLREKLRPLGNSLIVAGSTEKVRVHIHTNEPQRVFSLGEEFGRVTRRKYDDMRNQHSDAYGGTESTKIAVVTDSSCDLPSEFVLRHNIQMVPIQLTIGKEQYIDKITITPKEFYHLLQRCDGELKTSQPTPGEFRRTYEELWGHYEQAISIHLAGALSGTWQAAVTAAKSVPENRIRVLDGCNVSVGLGLLVAEAALAVEEGCDLDEVTARVERAAKNIRFFICFDTVEYLIKGGRLSRSRGLVARGLNVKPILSLNERGEVVTVAKSVGGQAALRKLMQLVGEHASGKRNLKFAVGHADAPEKAEWLAARIKRQFEVKDVMLVNVSPALGAHAGPGAAGVAFLGE